MDPAPTRAKPFHPIVAYCAPFVLYLVLTSLERWGPLEPYYVAVNAVKAAIVMALWWRFRRAYPPLRWNGAVLAIVTGAVGVVVWIALAGLGWERHLTEWLPAWLYSPDRIAYNPFNEIASLPGRIVFLAVRMAELSIVVPLMEEVFWRGFLMRYVIAEDFESVPIGTFTPLSFAVVTAGFVAVHPELLAALVWGTGINLLLYRTKNLWACIIAHAVTNFLLGVYILATGAWELW